VQAQRTYLYVSLPKGTAHKSSVRLDIKQILDVRHIAHRDKRALTDTAAALGIFADENMAVICATAANFTGTGNFEAFFRSAIGLYFWHIEILAQKVKRS
jgi:hypothetical protein